MKKLVMLFFAVILMYSCKSSQDTAQQQPVYGQGQLNYEILDKQWLVSRQVDPKLNPQSTYLKNMRCFVGKEIKIIEKRIPETQQTRDLLELTPEGDPVDVTEIKKNPGSVSAATPSIEQYAEIRYVEIVKGYYRFQTETGIKVYVQPGYSGKFRIVGIDNFEGLVDKNSFIGNYVMFLPKKRTRILN